MEPTEIKTVDETIETTEQTPDTPAAPDLSEVEVMSNGQEVDVTSEGEATDD